MKRHATNPEKVEQKTGRGQEGMTLVELMVALAISSFILASVFSVFTAQYKAWIVQSQVSEMQENGRTAMDMLVKDIRMAGFRKPDGPVNGNANAINPGNHGVQGTDYIKIVSAYRQVSTLTVAAAKNDNTITLQYESDAARFDDTFRRYILLDGISDHDHYEVTGVTGNQVTLSSGLVRDYPAGVPVFIVKSILYGIDYYNMKHPSLVRFDSSITKAGGQVIAHDVEDLQFAYEDADGNWHDNPSSPEDILAVRINVLVRTRSEGTEWKTAGLGTRPAIEDHAAATTKDGYRRRLLTTVVDVRNMGI